MDEKIQQVLNELETNLQEIDSAVKHIEKAGQVSKKVTQSVEKIQASYSQHLEKIQELLANKEEVRDKRLKEHISSIQSNLEDHLSKNQKQQNEQFKKVDEFLSEKENLIKRVEELKEYINSVDFPDRLDKLDNTVSSINIGLQNLQTSISEFKKDLKGSVDEKFQTIQDEQAKIREQQSKNQRIIWGLVGIGGIIVILEVLSLVV